MKGNVFVTKLAGGATATAMVSAAIIPTQHTLFAAAPVVIAEESVVINPAILPEAELHEGTVEPFVLTISNAPAAWNQALEREFRNLALAEANNSITSEDAMRLEKLSNWRDQLISPQTTDEILLQMKRNRLLNRMENLLREYVELQEATGQTRSTP